MPRYSWEYKRRFQDLAEGVTATPETEEKAGFPPALLQFLPPFYGLTQEEAKELCEIISTREYTDGQVIFDESSPGDCLFAVVKGRVDVKMKVDSSNAQTIASLPEGSVLGEMALLTQQSRSAAAVAVGNVLLLRLEVEDFQKLLDQGSLAAYKVIYNLGRVVAQRLRAVNEQLAAVSSQASPRRQDISELKKKLFTEWDF